MPELLKRAEGRAFVDYGFHLAPMMSQHIDELETLVTQHGIPSFKIFMFYGGHGLHGKSDDQSSFLMTPPGERYDYAHFEFVMRGLQKVREVHPDLAPYVSVGLHCETADIMRAYTEIVERTSTSRGLAAYSESRPPHSEGLAIMNAAYLAHETGLANINLLHLSSRKAIEAALAVADLYPEIDFRREVTIGHLLADLENTSELGGKVNPPIRPREDRDALWEALLAGHVDWVVTDHACCRDELKFGKDRQDVFQAKAGFGGTEYLLPGLLTEGDRRGLSLGRVAELICKNPAERFGVLSKGDVAVGFDADLVLVDPTEKYTVRAADSESSQEYTPFEGFEMTHRVKDVWLRGRQILGNGSVLGEPGGRFIARPTAAA